MKKISIVAALIVSGCTSSPQQNPEVPVVQACATYYAALNAAVQLANNGKLNQIQINGINNINSVIMPICTSKTPPIGTQLVNQIINAVAQISTLEGRP